MMFEEELTVFDNTADFTIKERHLPHWIQTGTFCFVTWRTADSLPVAARLQMEEELKSFLLRNNLDPKGNWHADLARRPLKEWCRESQKLHGIRDAFLDRGYGDCLLAMPECAEEVERCLLYFDGDRYHLSDLVIMPNHIHYLAAFRSEETFLKQNTDWKRYTARAINRLCDRRGEFWQTDQFDHLIRTEESLAYYRRYIAENPRKAGLNAQSFRYYARSLSR